MFKKPAHPLSKSFLILCSVLSSFIFFSSLYFAGEITIFSVFFLPVVLYFLISLIYMGDHLDVVLPDKKGGLILSLIILLILVIYSFNSMDNVSTNQMKETKVNTNITN